MPERTCCQAVVANNNVAHANDIGSGSSAGLIADGAPLQPVVQRRLPALESIDDMVARKKLRRRYHRPTSHDAAALSNLRSRSLGAGGLPSSD